MLVQGAWAASRTKNTYLSTKYRKLATRIGKKKALIALAHIMLISIYHMIKNREPYKDLGVDYLDNLHKTKIAASLRRKLEALGYTVALNPSSPPTGSPDEKSEKRSPKPASQPTGSPDEKSERCPLKPAKKSSEKARKTRSKVCSEK